MAAIVAGITLLIFWSLSIFLSVLINNIFGNVFNGTIVGTILIIWLLLSFPFAYFVANAVEGKRNILIAMKDSTYNFFEVCISAPIQLLKIIKEVIFLICKYSISVASILLLLWGAYVFISTAPVWGIVLAILLIGILFISVLILEKLTRK